MVEILGKPFLEYQIEQLREQGFERVLVLLGYLPEVVQNHFGDGSRWGIRVEYSVSAVEDETARRVKLAEPYLEPCFLLLYCDNYWPMQIERMWEKYCAMGAPAMITVYTNKDGYTRNSVRVEPDGWVSVYDKSCSHPALNGVEISYAIVQKKIVEELGYENALLETTVYPRLTARRQLAAFVTDHRYYSVGAHHRLPLTAEFFKRRKTIILDRDGVLNRRPPRARYVRKWSEFEWLPGAREALRLLNESGYRVVVISNQAGIARGQMTELDLSEIHRRMQQEAWLAGGEIEAVYYCPHGWEAGCECRKPSPGMLFQAQRDLHLDLSRTLFIGDDPRDGEAARRAGCMFVQVTGERPLLYWAQSMLGGEAASGGTQHGEKTNPDHGA